MGVPGLWDYLNEARVSRSLAEIAVEDGFKKNMSTRAYHVGIDAYIWLHHAASSKGGENPELRTLFFRVMKLCAYCANLLKLTSWNLVRWPFLLLFVFDGRSRPLVKRGSRMGKSGSHSLAKEFKAFLDAPGIEWREAKSEAEAELGYLNQGVIDAVMTDDCDVFLFGARTVIKNQSVKLSGNSDAPALNPAGKSDDQHVNVYRADDIRMNPAVGLTREGMILFALLAGGDYDKGVKNVGKVSAFALARCGFGERLLRAYEHKNPFELDIFLRQWRLDVAHEMRTNSHGFMKHGMPNFSLPETFPDIATLKMYAYPLTSATGGTGAACGPVRDCGHPDLGALAALCEKHFGEWGTTELILQRFRKHPSCMSSVDLLCKGVELEPRLPSSPMPLDRKSDNRTKIDLPTSTTCSFGEIVYIKQQQGIATMSTTPRP